MKIYAIKTKTNIRRLPSIDSDVVGSITSSFGVELENETNALWYKVKGGYVYKSVSIKRAENPYKNLIIQGAIAPSDELSKDTVKVTFSPEMKTNYLPLLKEIDLPNGLELLASAMAQKEGFYKGSRSFRTNNPGNIGNTDSGANSSFHTLKAGIEKQIDYLTKVANGENKNYPLGKLVKLKPFYSAEIEKNKASYQLEPYCPGYEFIYNGSLEQFIKIYSTGARQKNTYLSLIRSWFKMNGILITDKTTLKEILLMK